MRAMVFEGVGRPLRLAERDAPEPGPGQVGLRVEACGICRTDLHLLDGEVDVPHPPLVFGHQIVGMAERDGRRVGVPWLGWTCGTGAPGPAPPEHTKRGRNQCPVREAAGTALADLRAGRFTGAAVVVP